MTPFTYQSLPARVVFGWGTLGQVADEVRRLPAARAMIVATPEQTVAADALADRLDTLVAGVFAEAAMHTPVAVSERATATAQAVGADCVVAIGGGSAIGLGKAVALRTGLPQIAVPTTYAGSEATPIIGQTDNGRKLTTRDMAVLPRAIVYDVALTTTLPPAMTANSGMNAVAHAVEALYARDRNPLIGLLAADGGRAMANGLRRLATNGTDAEGRSDALYAAWACGTCLGAVGMALHHKLCHVLGGSFGLPHAETHAVVLPHAVAYNGPAIAPALRILAEVLGCEDAAAGLQALGRTAGAARSLAGIGLAERDLDRAADLAVADPDWRPRPIERAGIRALLADAFAGADVRSPVAQD